MPERVSILGIPVDALDMHSALAAVDAHIQHATQPGYILAVNPEKVFAVKSNLEMMDFFSRATLLLPDGIGVVWAARTLHNVDIHRVPGADLMLNIVALSSKKGYKLFILSLIHI